MHPTHPEVRDRERVVLEFLWLAVLMRAPINGGSPVELGYVFTRDAWGKGYAAEVARALLQHSFELANVTRIVAAIELENHASRRIVEKIGMRAEEMDGDQGVPVEVFPDRPGRWILMMTDRGTTFA